VSVDPPVRVEVEIPDGATAADDLAVRIDNAVRAKLIFRCAADFKSVAEFGDVGYKTKATVRRPS
jgi:hypothetical protein